jgi:hypothetical protein
MSTAPRACGPENAMADRTHPPRLTAADLAAAATEHRVEVAALRALIAVESGGRGFLPNGWLKILFERHILWKRLRLRGLDPGPLAAARPDLCGVRWDRRHYRGGAAEWDRVAGVLAWAGRNTPEQWESYKKAAYESCSWGLFQLMGFHYASVGFPDVYAFKHALETGEAEHLRAILAWMEGNGLLAVLRAKDWRRLARGYNGDGQVERYSALLAEAYARAGGNPD